MKDFNVSIEKGIIKGAEGFVAEATHNPYQAMITLVIVAFAMLIVAGGAFLFIRIKKEFRALSSNGILKHLETKFDLIMSRSESTEKRQEKINEKIFNRLDKMSDNMYEMNSKLSVAYGKIKNK